MRSDAVAAAPHGTGASIPLKAGALLGVGAAKLISYFAQWPTLLSAPAVAGSFLFSGAVGVFFGFYPARKASRLDPIAALRYE